MTKPDAKPDDYAAREAAALQALAMSVWTDATASLEDREAAKKRLLGGSDESPADCSALTPLELDQLLRLLAKIHPPGPGEHVPPEAPEPTLLGRCHLAEQALRKAMRTAQTAWEAVQALRAETGQPPPNNVYTFTRTVMPVPDELPAAQVTTPAPIAATPAPAQVDTEQVVAKLVADAKAKDDFHRILLHRR